MSNNYYKEQFNKIPLDNDTMLYGITMRFSAPNGSTHYLQLNQQSKEEFDVFFNNYITKLNDLIKPLNPIKKHKKQK